MPVPTPELGLLKGVDADDTADYLATSLANSLTTVDALFNSVSGHTHNGPHQGAAIEPAVGSITSSMIAPNAVQQQLGQFFGGVTFSTTTVSTWLVTPASVVVTSSGNLLRIEVSTALAHSLPGGLFFTTIGIDGTPQANLSQSQAPGANYMVSIAYTYYTTLSPGSHTIALYVQSANGGTLALSTLVGTVVSVTEQKR